MKTQIIAFKGRGKLFKTLSFFLGCFSPKWRKLEWKPWHLAPVVGWSKGRPVVFEHIKPYCLVGFRTVQQGEDCKIYTLPKNINPKNLSLFLGQRINKKYDVGVYFWTIAQYIILRTCNHSIPRILNDRFTCWELSFEFARASGQPLQEYCGKNFAHYPMITDFLDSMEALGIEGKILKEKTKI